MPKTNDLLMLCRAMLPGYTFQTADSFYWSPHKKVINYSKSLLGTVTGNMALFHEMGHATLNHTRYTTDADLLFLEAAAWQEAMAIARTLSAKVDKKHIEDCLDTYRDWLYTRSTCPACGVNSLQVSHSQYKCINCATVWTVSPSRFCRPYRMRARNKKIPSNQTDQMVFS